MSIQITNILIWQKSGLLRNLEIELNAVNVITGESGKGKSSILHIIDYCLLSSTADGISKENIDDKSSWYGLRLYTSKGLISIARTAYHVGETTKVYYSDTGEIPESPVLNMTTASLKKLLDKEFGLDSEMKVPYGGKTIKAGTKISFRNFLSFCYQDQNVLVSPEYLYNKSSILKVVERIERTFKMAIGIVDAKGAIANERLNKLKIDELKLIRKSELIGKKKLEFQEDVTLLEEEAVSLGLLNKTSQDIYDSLANLEKISTLPIEQFGNTSNDIVDLERQELQISQKIKKFKNFNSEYNNYRALLKKCDESIIPVEYLLSKYQEILPGTKANDVLTALEIELKEAKLLSLNKDKSLLLIDIEDQTKELEVLLSELKEKKENLQKLSSQLSAPQEIYRYQGKLSVKVELYSDKHTTLDYSDEISKVQSEIAQLEQIVRNIDSKREFVMGELNKKINEHLNRLKLKGYEGSQAVFLESEKAINLIIDGGRKVEKMIDIGSASNYLYLHLSYFMALHKVARNNHVPWLPYFLILDQVSTPYTGTNPDDEDSLNLALIELNTFIEEMKSKGGMQIILMEHISEERWTNLGLKNFKLVDRELIGDYGLIN